MGREGMGYDWTVKTFGKGTGPPPLPYRQIAKQSLWGLPSVSTRTPGAVPLQHAPKNGIESGAT